MAKTRPAVIDLILRWRPRPGGLTDLDVILECPKKITPPNDWIAEQLCRLAAKMRTKEDKSYLTIQPRGREPGFLETERDIGPVEIRDFARFLGSGDTLNLLMRSTMEEVWSIAGPHVEFIINRTKSGDKSFASIDNALAQAQKGRDKFLKGEEAKADIDIIKSTLESIT